MAYIALYRRFRPQGFSELVGQEAVRRTISQAIASGRVAHAYLFAGPRGTGKTSTAKIMARLLNCEHPQGGEPCGECFSCRQIEDGSSLDVYEIDAASNRGIDEIRQLRDTVKFAATGGRYKIYIIDEVHMLTTEAFNALLKTLEEPPPQVVFILATTEAHKVPTTIKSRCQRYDFRRIPLNVIAGRLKDVAAEAGLSVEEEAVGIIARAAEGGMRDALSLLDQCAALAGGGAITAEEVNRTLGIVSREAVEAILRAVAEKNPALAAAKVEETAQDGRDLKQLVIMLQTVLRRAMIFQAVKAPGKDESPEETAMISRVAAIFGAEEFIPIITRLHDTLKEIANSEDSLLAVETAVLGLAQPPRPVSLLKSTTPPETPYGVSTPLKGGQELGMPPPQPIKQPLPPAPPTQPISLPQPKTPPPPPQNSELRTPNSESDSLPLTPEGERLWALAVDKLKSEAAAPGSFFSCLDGAKFDGLNDSALRLKFNSKFHKNQIAKAANVRLIETALAAVSGKNLKLLLADADKKGKRALPSQNAAGTTPPPPSKKPAALKDALDFFGLGDDFNDFDDVPPPTDEDY